LTTASWFAMAPWHDAVWEGVLHQQELRRAQSDAADLVAEVHQEYVRAGADPSRRTRSAPNRLEGSDRSPRDKLHAINSQGAEIARHAAREQAYVAGAMGPLGIRIEPWGKTGVDEAREYFREQAQALADAAVDLSFSKRFRDLNEIGAAIDAVRACRICRSCADDGPRGR